jgi:hypothetical protein
MKVRVKLRDGTDQDISAAGELSIEVIDNGVLAVNERKDGRNINTYSLRNVGLFAPGTWLSAREITDED